MRVNLWDAAFAHVPFSVPGRVSRNIEWVRQYLEWEGVTVVTDAYLADGHIFDRLRSTHTVGWLLEGRAYGARNYNAVPNYIRHLDILMTHDAEILATYPEKARFVPFGGCWIPDDLWGMHPKTGNVSHIYSDKRFMRGHVLRHEIAERFPALDTFGLGTPRALDSKFPMLAPYRFSIVVENDRADNYFTEKLLDCFAVGTIPIYWGAPNIGGFFDTRGIIPFSDLNQLAVILGALDYERHREAAEANMQAARLCVLPEDYMYPHVLKDLEGR